MLDADGTAFQALYRDTPKRLARGSVVTLHGRLAVPMAEKLLDPLRAQLGEHGWANLAPRLIEPGDAAAGVARIKASVEYLKSRNTKTVVLLGYDSGARLALAYLLQQPDPVIRALVMIDPPPPRETLGLDLDPDALAKLRLPILELRTGQNQPTASDDATAWRIAFRTNPGYRQSILHDPQTDWQDVEDFVTGRIHGWLVKMLKPETPPPTNSPAKGPAPI